MKQSQQQTQKPLEHSATLPSNNPKQEHHQKQSYIKFKSTQFDQCYIPKLRVIAKNNQVQLGYVYKLKNVKPIRNLDDMEENVGEKCQIISDVKKKGIKDFKVNIKKVSEQKHTSIVVATTPFKTNQILHYFQVRLQSLSNQTSPIFSLGLTNDSENVMKNKNTVCYNFALTEAGNLQIIRNLNNIDELTNFKVEVRDVIGCGFIYHRNQVFLTHNGRIIKNRMKMYYPERVQDPENPLKNKKLAEVVDIFNIKFYPFITVGSKKISLQAVFENSFVDFMIPYSKYIARCEEKLLEEQIPSSIDISEQSVYGLVLSYFKYNGFDKSSQKLQQQMLSKNMKFYPQNQPIRNKLQYARRHDILERGKQKRIKKASKRHRLPRVYSGEIDLQNLNNEQNHSRSNDDDSGSRGSQSSDNQSYQQFYKLKNSSIASRRSKKSIEHQEGSDQGQDSQKRMEEQLSYRINRKKMQKRVEQLKRSEEQKFKGERIQIMRNIQEGKLQQALKLFTKSYKKLRLKQKYLEVYFKAHIFLKLYHQQGLQKALQYAKQEHKTFTEYENYLMPFFNMKSLTNPNQKQCQFRPLRQILFLICPQNKLQFNLQRQLQIFADFISNLICEECGFFGSSKLELVLNHYQVVEKKVNDLEIPIGGIDLEEMNLI